MSTIAVNAITDANGGATTTINSVTPNANNVVGKNKIINGNMAIDQRNAGAAVTINTAAPTYTVDRWFAWGQGSDGVFTVQQSSTAPSNFTNSLAVTVTTADASIGASQLYIISHKIEGYNIADLGWGTASAKSVCLSFQVRSSVTGTFSGSLKNSDGSRSYPFTYTISSANTWEQKSVTVVGETSGTWLTTNGTGITLTMSLGSGSNRLATAGAWAAGNYDGATGATTLISTNGATFYITGVQLEVGDTATEFEHRPYGTELQLCQRYYTRFQTDGSGFAGIATGFQGNTTESLFAITFPTQMRAEPTATINNLSVSDVVTYGASATLGGFYAGFQSGEIRVTHSASGAQFRPATLTIANNTTGFLALSSEL